MYIDAIQVSWVTRLHKIKQSPLKTLHIFEKDNFVREGQVAVCFVLKTRLGKHVCC